MFVLLANSVCARRSGKEDTANLYGIAAFQRFLDGALDRKEGGAGRVGRQ